jgi:hypothetical protein
LVKNLKLDLINSAEGSTALFSLCFKFLVVKAFATVSYNVTGICARTWFRQELA